MTVYCTKCGAKNEDAAGNCIQCGQSLYSTHVGRSRREEEMCFGLPHYWAGIIFGLFLITLGVFYFLQQYYEIKIEFWTVFLIFIGVLIIASALYRMRR